MSKVLNASNKLWKSALPLFNTSRYAATAPAAQREGLKDINKAPGPFVTPYLGSGPALLLDKNFHPLKIHKYMEYAVKKYGPIWTLDSFGLRSVCVSDPDDIQKVFEATKDNPARNGIESLERIRNNDTNNYFEGKLGVFLEDGEEWWRVRSKAQGPMMKPKIVKNYLDGHNQVALEFLDIIAEFQNKYGEMPGNFQDEIYKWALESVALVALDKRLGCLNKNLPEDSVPIQLIKNANLMFESVNKTEIGLRLWRLYETKAYKELRTAQKVFIEVTDKSIRQTVEELENKPQGAEATLMETLLKMPGLSYKDVVTMVLDMLFAGIDTTSHTMAFALYLLAKNPDKQQKLQNEIDEIFGDRQDFTAADIAKLSYTKLVVKETLRLFPIGIGNIRKLHDDLEIQGYLVPKGYGVLTLNLIPSREEKYFQRAAEFIPERWLRSRPLGPIHPFASLPFGVGTRMCIGRRIAEQEMYVFLTRVLQRFNIDYKYKDIDIKSKLVFAPSEPLKFNFTERK